MTPIVFVFFCWLTLFLLLFWLWAGTQWCILTLLYAPALSPETTREEEIPLHEASTQKVVVCRYP
jgi:hypothetical protein